MTSNGQLRAATLLESSDARYKRLLLTIETLAHPKTPGTTVLAGRFSLR